MRLINVDTMKLEEFLGNDVPEYYILSHTWGAEEVSYQAFLDRQRRTRSMLGYVKIQDFCRYTQEDKVHYAWVDTCCINKSSSAELTEAINAMYRWYSNAKCCIVFLEDFCYDIQGGNTSSSPFFRRCRWFKRGWCLQELVAPKLCFFVDKTWSRIGSRSGLAQTLENITGIKYTVLKGEDPPDYYNIATRMSWAAKRQTTRPEDMAYCLLGLMKVNMPLLYGEGRERAFLRLQEAIVRTTADWSVFTWVSNPPNEHITPDVVGETGKVQKQPPSVYWEDTSSWSGLFARSPADFRYGPMLGMRWIASMSIGEVEITSHGVKFSDADLHMVPICHNGINVAALKLHLGNTPTGIPVGIFVFEASPQTFVRVLSSYVFSTVRRKTQTETPLAVRYPPWCARDMPGGGTEGHANYGYFDSHVFYISRTLDQHPGAEVDISQYHGILFQSALEYSVVDVYPSKLWAATRQTFFKQGVTLLAYITIRLERQPQHLLTLFMGKANNGCWCYMTTNEQEVEKLRVHIKKRYSTWTDPMLEEGLFEECGTFYPYRIHKKFIPGLGVVQAKCSADRRHAGRADAFVTLGLDQDCTKQDLSLDRDTIIHNTGEGFADGDGPQWSKIDYIAGLYEKGELP